VTKGREKTAILHLLLSLYLKLKTENRFRPQKLYKVRNALKIIKNTSGKTDEGRLK